MSYQSAKQKTFYFIGVSTSSSVIMKVFPAWAQFLGLDAVIRGIDFKPNSNQELYRKTVAGIKDDPLALGALVTTHKMNLLAASRSLFDQLDAFAELLGEISCISKCGNLLVGKAKDPVSAGAAYEAIVPKDHWQNSSGHLCILGSGGSALALTLYLHNKQRHGADVPVKMYLTARRESKLKEIQDIHQKWELDIETEYVLTPEAGNADDLLTKLPPRSMVINATGMGKDCSGSPLTNLALFPEQGIIWEFNYRGELDFLNQAKKQQRQRKLQIEDGWIYFIHGWTRVIDEVFQVDIPMNGEIFDTLCTIAKEQQTRN